MTDAPKRIWALSYEKNIVTCGGDDLTIRRTEWLSEPCGSASEYHLARPNQPCSTDEFLRRVMARGDDCTDFDLVDRNSLNRIDVWLSGDFTAAMEGLE